MEANVDEVCQLDARQRRRNASQGPAAKHAAQKMDPGQLHTNTSCQLHPDPRSVIYLHPLTVASVTTASHDSESLSHSVRGPSSLKDCRPDKSMAWTRLRALTTGPRKCGFTHGDGEVRTRPQTMEGPTMSEAEASDPIVGSCDSLEMSGLTNDAIRECPHGCRSVCA